MFPIGLSSKHWNTIFWELVQILTKFMFFPRNFFPKNHLNISIFAKIESYIYTIFADTRDHESFAKNRRKFSALCDGCKRIIWPWRKPHWALRICCGRLPGWGASPAAGRLFVSWTASSVPGNLRKFKNKYSKWGALCRSLSPNFNVPNINVLHINGSLLQPWVVEVQSTLAVSKALQINGSIHQW